MRVNDVTCCVKSMTSHMLCVVTIGCTTTRPSRTRWPCWTLLSTLSSTRSRVPSSAGASWRHVNRTPVMWSTSTRLEREAGSLVLVGRRWIILEVGGLLWGKFNEFSAMNSSYPWCFAPKLAPLTLHRTDIWDKYRTLLKLTKWQLPRY